MGYMRDKSGRRLDSIDVLNQDARRLVGVQGELKATPSRIPDGRLGNGAPSDLLINTSVTITADTVYQDVRVGTAGNVLVASGVTVRVLGETQNNGVIRMEATDGQAATGATGGLGGGVPTRGAGSTYLIAGASGQAGQNGAVTAGTAGAQAATKLTHGGAGGNGGSGGASSTTTGGAGAAPIAKTSPISRVQTLEQAYSIMALSTLASAQGGSGAGSGGGDGTFAGGGGGGSGSAGGMGLWLTTSLSGSGVFIAAGGNGGAGGAAAGGNAGGGGGGAGGGGGIIVVAAHDARLWTGTVGAPGGAGGAGGAKAGTGAAGTAGTAGGSGVALLTTLNTLRATDVVDIRPRVVFNAENAAPSQAVQLLLAQMPARFRGGPMQQVTIGSNTYLLNGLYSPNGGFAGKNNGGAPYVLDYHSDADAHSIGLFAGNGKFRLKVDGEWVNDYTVVPYSGGTGGIIWLQVSFSRRRQIRRFEWHMSSVPVAGIAVDATASIYPATEPLDLPRAIVGDSFAEGASGNTNAGTWEMGGWAQRLARKMGWDNLIVDAQGGTGYTNDGGFANGKKPYPQRILDDFGPLPARMMPKQFVVAGGFNDADAAGLQAAAAATYANIATVAPAAFVDVLYFTNTGSPAAGYLSGRTKIKTAALAAPNVRLFVDGITGEVTAGPACQVDIAPSVARPFLTGTGHVGATVGDGNADILVSSDAIHPSYPDGHEYLAMRAYSALLLGQPRA